MKLNYLVLLLVLIAFSGSCNAKNKSSNTTTTAQQNVSDNLEENKNSVINGADQINEIVELVKNKRVALIVNQTSTVGDDLVLLPDTLLKSGVNIVKLFAPEHGFRGDADAGETVKNGIDVKTGLPIISLSGRDKKPTAEQPEDQDVILFDVRYGGARCYCFYSRILLSM